VESFKSFLNSIILLGAIQGLITIFLLFKSNNKSNKLLAWIILLISLACLDVYLLQTLDNNIKSTTYSVLRAIFPLGIYMPIGPLIYFYVKSLLRLDFNINKFYWPHFYTIIIDAIPYLIALVYVLGVFIKVVDTQYSNVFGNAIYMWNIYADIPRWISLVFYLWLTYKVIRDFKNIQNYQEQFKWVKQLFKGFSLFSLVWLFYLIPYVIPEISDVLVSSLGWFPIYIPLTVLIYWLGINGYIIGNKTKRVTYTKVKLESYLIEKTLLTLDDAMQKDSLYLNPSLKLNDVVTHTQIPQKTISAVLNQHLNKSFNEYINEYRIEEVKSKLVNPDFSHLTITGIALESGFNSQATFQRTFKAVTKQSPKEFRLRATNIEIKSSQI